MVENNSELFIFRGLDKWEALSLVDGWRHDMGFGVEEVNIDKPWGAYWKVSRRQCEQFIETFFPQKKDELEGSELSLSPKFLLVAPGKRLSWQYHERRAELWKVVYGDVGVSLSENDTEGEGVIMSTGESVSLGQGVRHRLSGKEGWGLVAEIWVHTDPKNPSDEEDIVRLQDDYARNKTF